MFGWQRVGLIERVGVQRLAAAQNRSKRLYRRPHDIVLRLLPRKRTAGCLGVEPQLPTTFFFCSEAFPHQVRPHFPRSPVLGDLLKKIVMCVEEEAEPWSKRLDGHFPL